MLDSASEDAFTKDMCGNAYENNDSSNNCKNIDNSVIEHLYQILFDKEIMIPYKGLHEICKQLSNRYIKSDLNSNEYVFQHLTVFEAVLYSYWHNKTMENVIKYFKVDILAEHVRPFDSVDKCKKRYLIVPMTKCTSLAHKLCETFLADCSNISKWSTLINQSEFTLNLFNLKLDEWYTIEENIRNCSWSVISEFIRPFNYKMDNNEICAHTKINI
ncbi:unnamed protein product [Mytilus edulis]|uniref:Uncharacterized protein n=1 Tax=Mytilus edulis TaxID=6550 RepID=A0A8S3QDI5_MYTED|nr:unnamed protein product [Mytilus edulis]